MRKLSITQAWNEAVALLRREAGLLLPVALAFFGLPLVLLQLAAPDQTAGAPAQLGSWMLWIIPTIFVTIIGTLTISLLTLREGISVGEALGAALRRLPAFMLASLLISVVVGAIVIGIMAVLIGVLLAAADGGGGGQAAVTALTFVALLPVMIFFMTRLMLMSPVAANEAVGPIQIIRRSWTLTKGHVWRLIGFVLLASIGFAVVSLAATAVIGSLLALLLGAPEPGNLTFVILLLLGGVLNAIWGAFYTVVVARIYAQLGADQRDVLGEIFG